MCYSYFLFKIITKPDFMKKNRLILLAFYACIFLLVGCKDDDEIEKVQEPKEEKEIVIDDLLGTYEALSSGAGASIWTIDTDKISIACTDAVSYTFKNNVLNAKGIAYKVKEIEKGERYELTYKSGETEMTVALKTTANICPEEDPDEDGQEEPDDDIPTVGVVELDKLYGYGEGTTGGEGAAHENTHHFDNGDKFREWLKLREKNKSKEPAIIWLSGTFTKENGRDSSSPWFDIKDTENISIYGTNNFKMQNVGFFIVRSKNIIIRNVYIVMPKADNGADGISMQKSNNIWLDHCTFESVNSTKDYEDGSCDITHGTTDVTVSWNHFIRTQKTALVGHSDNEIGDKDIRATFHHNFFDESNSRHPRVRFGSVHVYNNYFNKVSTYGVGSAMEAKVLVESNYFDGVHLPTDICTFPAKKSGSSWVSNLTGQNSWVLICWRECLC